MGAREEGTLGRTCRTPRHWIQTICVADTQYSKARAHMLRSSAKRTDLSPSFTTIIASRQSSRIALIQRRCAGLSQRAILAHSPTINVYLGQGRPTGYLIRKASFFSLRAFISSRIQRGVAPLPAQVSLESFLLRYLAATLRPFSEDPARRPDLRPRLRPLPTSVPVSRESCF